ncbi:MAG TPA: divalent-cation tolerance protein CutA [Dehalococcoidia bacterium]|nr:divalent-cation tolerance protein CutA [Dehalococcoidia bacterium]
MMEQQSKIVILITTSSEGEARKVADLLLNERKAACVNIVPKVESLFWWQGKIESAQENLLIVKTNTAKLKEITDLIKKVHTYEVPEIIALPIIGGNEDYIKWLDAILK